MNSKQSSTDQKGGILNKGFGKIKTLMQSKESKLNDEIVRHSNLIFQELSRYVQYLCNFNVPFDKANKLLLFLCNHY